MSAPNIDSTREALTRARGHAGATLASLGEAVEEFAHEAVEKLEETLPVLAEKAAGRAGELAGAASAVAATARELVEDSGGRLEESVTAARRELAHRIDPDDPTPRRWWWIGAGLLLTAVSAAAWYLLSRRPQPVEAITDAPPTTPPGDVDLAVDTPAAATRNGKS